jgi:hypothetical protein
MSEEGEAIIDVSDTFWTFVHTASLDVSDELRETAECKLFAFAVKEKKKMKMTYGTLGMENAPPTTSSTTTLVGVTFDSDFIVFDDIDALFLCTFDILCQNGPPHLFEKLRTCVQNLTDASKIESIIHLSL